MIRGGLCTYRILARAIYPGGASQRRVRIARCTRSMASDVAAVRGNTSARRTSSRTALVLPRIFSAINARAAASVPPRYSIAAQITPPALAMKIGKHEDTTGGEGLFCLCRQRNVGAFGDDPGLQAPHVAGMDDIGACRRDPNIAWDVNHRIRAKLADARVVDQCRPFGLERQKRRKVQPIPIGDRAACVAGTDKHRSLLGEETSSVLSDRAKTLNDDPGAG